MPEYLAPGVYVEEIDTGSKPIEGVSTSTTGMVGVTERGPVNIPILITGNGEFQRWFGGYLRKDDFPDQDRERTLRFLPHAVEGFFNNGGKRVFVVRVLDPKFANNASAMMFDRGSINSANTVLLRSAAENTGTAANPPLLLVLSGANLAQNDWIRIGDGSDAEYHQLAQAPAPENVLVPLAFPLSRSHTGVSHPTVEQIPRTPLGAEMTLVNAAVPGDVSLVVMGVQADISVFGATLPNNPLLEIGTENIGEHRFVVQSTQMSPTSARIRLDSPLVMPYPANTSLILLDASATATASAHLDPAARAGDTVLFVDNRAGKFQTRTDLVIIDRGNAAMREVRRIGDLHQLTISSGVQADFPAGSILQAVSLNETNRLTLTGKQNKDDTSIQISDVSSLSPGQRLVIGTGTNREAVAVQSINSVTREVTLTSALKLAKANGDPVADANHPTLDIAQAIGDNTITVSHIDTLMPDQTLRVGSGATQENVVVQSINQVTRVVTLTAPLTGQKAVGDQVLPLRALTASPAAGDPSIAIDNRMGLQVGDVLRIGLNPNEEFVTVSALPNPAPAGVAPDAGNVTLAQSLSHSYDRTTDPVVRMTPLILTPSVQPSVLVLRQSAGDKSLLVSDGGGATGYAVGSFISLTEPGSNTYYHRVVGTKPATPQMVTLSSGSSLTRLHPLGSPVVERRPLCNVVALDAGQWGNRLHISIEDEAPGLVATTTLWQMIGLPTQIRLGSTAGMEPGTVLELVDPATNLPPDNELLKVISINRNTSEVMLAAPGLSGSQQTAIAALPSGTFMRVRSREFRLTVRLLRQPDPAVPTRSESVLDIEVFRNLSMDHRHSRYIHKVIGTTWSNVVGTANDDDEQPLRRADRRSEGESLYIRVRDQATNPAATEPTRLGPETLVDPTPAGTKRAARHALNGGDDAVANITDDIYRGQDDPEPERRTGLASLRSEEEIAIVAIPGRISAALQGALIGHCELMRYRFAVLDGPQPPDDSLNDVQGLRQQYDTKYAALYHPWLLIPDPYPANLGQVANYPIPPSGHVAGIYARTDIERGVHKAPANEVVRGVIGLRRSLNKGEQDILNPFPVNINVIRDFRLDNRGIRVYGGRVITSDPDWKYVNVRRLLIFMENSLDRGLQWVVFEPNAEPLWARVRRSISNFLTVVWRNGALEGTTKEEAFFVKCDRTTMTQTDIDNGRLIVVIGVAPVKPAEFVIVRIGLWTAHAED